MKKRTKRVLIAVLCVMVLVVCVMYFVKKDKEPPKQEEGVIVLALR